MEIQISSEISSLIPDFKIGIIEYKNITVADSPPMLKSKLQLYQESLYFDLENKNVTELPGVQEWRSIFKKTGKDPNRYRPSVEALYRRVKKQNFLHAVQSAIDVNNLFSLQYEVPIGIYDLEKLSESITIRIGKENEEYIGLNGRSNSLQQLILSADSQGPFGSPFVDSERSPVTEKTKNALQIIYLRPSTSLDSATKLTESLMNMFIQIHGGEASFHVLS
ncbi:MAG TPA: phenylalanine--tRNA ligase beta subunit-related protein [Bacillales bacterium]|nr:phenylalanine--tRNA ligase beta subunit-related protein [Bacillales bacterium]